MKNVAYCPYCVSHGSKSVTCDSLVTGSRTTHRFETTRRKQAWFDRVCCTEKYARCCPAAITLNALLGDDAPGPEECLRLMERRAREAAREQLEKKRRSVYLRRMKRR